MNINLCASLCKFSQLIFTVLMYQLRYNKDKEVSDGFERLVNTVTNLKKNGKLKENYIAGMIHDIRNPLSSMICSLDFMRENEKI